MVQVDVFWSYGLGATFAVASSRQLIARRRAAQAQREGGSAAAPLLELGTSPLSRWSDPYLLRTLLFLALVFVPSGAWLLWAFPSWETMHAGDRDMPVWLVTLFTITNVTQGLLGYLVTEWLIARGRSYLAYLQVVLAYAGMFFILVHGWDGTGYQRFFSETREDFLAWDGDWSAWLTSDVALSLYGMGVVLLPVLLGTVAHWHVRGYALDRGGRGARPGRIAVMVLTLATVFVGGLGIAVAAHLAIAWLGAAAGIPVAVALAAGALVPRGPVHRLYRAYGLPEEGAESAEASPGRARVASRTAAARA
jgi:hypothetical protein